MSQEFCLLARCDASGSHKLAMKADPIVRKFPPMVLGCNLLPKGNGLANSRQCLLADFPLAPTPRQCRAANRKAILALDEFNFGISCC